MRDDEMDDEMDFDGNKLPKKNPNPILDDEDPELAGEVEDVDSIDAPDDVDDEEEI